MNGTRILGAVCAGILATSLGTLVACGGSSDDKASTIDPAITAKTVQAASVMVEIADANGYKIGQATATVIAPRLVLTAGHMISGQSKWVITTVDGKKVTGSKGMTYDWRSYESDKAHPRRHDVGVIYLDSPIKLDAYPTVLGETSTMDATRIRGTGASFVPVASSLSWTAQQPNSYVTDMPGAESLDTGGALFTGAGIVGVVEGKGLTSNKLYMARTDELKSWLDKKTACAGSSTTTTFAAAAPKQQICDDGRHRRHRQQDRLGLAHDRPQHLDRPERFAEVHHRRRRQQRHERRHDGLQQRRVERLEHLAGLHQRQPDHGRRG